MRVWLISEASWHRGTGQFCASKCFGFVGVLHIKRFSECKLEIT